MAPTNEQLAAMGLYAPPPPDLPPPDPGQAIPPILSPSAPALPSSSLGDKIDPGMKIPADKMNSAAILGGHPEEVPQDQTKQAGQDAYHDAIPKITAMPGSADYYRQRQSQLDFKQAHPWGDPISAQPGILGKIGHIAAKVGNIAGEIFAPGMLANIPGTDLHNEVERAQNERGITRGIEDESRQASTAATQEATREAPEELKLKQQKEEDARAPKPKEEEWSVIPTMVGPHGEPLQQEKNSGQIRLAPGMAGVQPLKGPNEPDKDKDIGDYLQAHGLPDNPANREKARGAIANRGKQEPGTYMPLYDPKTGQIAGAWDPKSGHLINAPSLPGTTAVGAGMANKADEKTQAATSTVHSFTRYQQSFHDLAPKLTEDDRRAMQVLTSHQDQIAKGFLDKAASGVLDTMFGEPLTGYSEKAMGGIMTKDQFDKLSPAGKKMLADYFSTVIQNFGNMKQILGSIGRNPMQLQAEINTIPLPYLDQQTADTMFQDKLEDLRMRNPGLAPPAAQSQTQGGSSSGRRVIDLTK